MKNNTNIYMVYTKPLTALIYAYKSLIWYLILSS